MATKTQARIIGKKLGFTRDDIIDYIEERNMGTWRTKHEDLEKDMKAYQKKLIPGLPTGTHLTKKRR